MIYCDHHIEQAIQNGRLIINPIPKPDQYNPSSIDLCVGDDFYFWKGALKAAGTCHSILLDDILLSDLGEFTDRLPVNNNGIVAIPPGAFVLVRTLEYVALPKKSKLAARVEGKSKQARLGMSVHITAPTIHAGFEGQITLEILNHGPFELLVTPNETRLCQLIIEEVSGVPRSGGSSFAKQTTPLGTPKKKK
jgi:dCTP deaminase